tara:strand:- start:3211 stop:3534 length:324 start_codon:yes stop_codon:yes gene_type:complete
MRYHSSTACNRKKQQSKGNSTPQPRPTAAINDLRTERLEGSNPAYSTGYSAQEVLIYEWSKKWLTLTNVAHAAKAPCFASLVTGWNDSFVPPFTTAIGVEDDGDWRR